MYSVSSVKCTNLNVQLDEFYKAIYPCDHHSDQDLRRLQFSGETPSCPFTVTSLLQKNSILSSITINDLPDFELHINRLI